MLLLSIALGIIFAAAIVPTLAFTIKRDREEEMIHRGVQYSRAIRAYYKKFGRYPTKLEDLENTNNLRFLRKRYKDPITGKDFKLLHFGEVQLSLSGIGGGTIPGASPIGGTPGGLNGGPAGSGGLSQSSSTFGGSSGSFGGNSGGFGGSGGFGANSNSSFGQNQSGQNQQTNGTSATGTTATGTDPSQAGSSQAGSQTNSSSTSADGTGNNPAAPGDGNGSNQIGSGQIIGGPIVGVASISKDKTIREFNHKTKYKDWVFVYDPGTDRGGIITTPYQPQLMAFGQQGTPNLNGQSGSNGNGTNGTNGTGFGNSSFGSGNSSFGSSPSGTQNSPNGGAGGFSTPNPPSNPPQQ